MRDEAKIFFQIFCGSSDFLLERRSLRDTQKFGKNSCGYDALAFAFYLTILLPPHLGEGYATMSFCQGSHPWGYAVDATGRNAVV